MEFIKSMVEKKGPEKSDYKALHKEIDRIGILLEQSSPDIQYADLLAVISPVLTTETMQGFAFNKPHGYPGDYEIIDRIYRKWKSEKEDFRRWDEFFHAQKATIAVRNRKKIFLNVLSSSEMLNQERQVLNIGSGPGRDMLEFFERHPDAAVCFDCIDYDEDSITYASKLCEPYLNRITFHCKNIFRYKPEKKYDIIWSAGLFDYLDDRQFIFLVEKLYAHLKPGGSMIIGNFSIQNPTKKYMELFGKWFLYHRHEDELIDLALQAGINSQNIDVFSEQLNVNLFLRIVKP
ncbi:Methyltransferase type 12 [Prosthecochloris aestuarii DSM 271]|uniref:Methyltransferase type 12 n=2 Tax=Prosthecochloris aestuarii TaxID=1102 RepID=B4S694_PROA2|nr:Methyltransferase type 12 [Prosthecochloris aestuarii DSM 271]